METRSPRTCSGAGEAEGDGAHAGLGHGGRQRGGDAGDEVCGAGLKELEGAEVEEFDGALTGDHDVAGFEIAVEDEVAMDVGDGSAELDHLAEDLVDGGFGGVADLVQALAVDHFHDEEGDAFVGDAAIEQAGDVGVLEAGEGVALEQEMAEGGGMLEVAADDLDGGLRGRGRRGVARSPR